LILAVADLQAYRPFKVRSSSIDDSGSSFTVRGIRHHYDTLGLCWLRGWPTSLEQRSLTDCYFDQTRGAPIANVHVDQLLRRGRIVVPILLGPLCRRASKAASQARWLAKPDNRDSASRCTSPEFGSGGLGMGAIGATPQAGAFGYKMRECANPLIDAANKTSNPSTSPLQEIRTAQPAVLLGLIAHLVDTPLQMSSSPLRVDCYAWAETSSPHQR